MRTLKVDYLSTSTDLANFGLKNFREQKIFYLSQMCMDPVLVIIPRTIEYNS